MHDLCARQHERGRRDAGPARGAAPGGGRLPVQLGSAAPGGGRLPAQLAAQLEVAAGTPTARSAVSLPREWR